MDTVSRTNTKEYNQRIVILGDYSVGKSSIALQYVKDTFNENEESTIGAAFLTKTIMNRGSYVKFEIWDTAGRERYNSLIPMYYRGAQAALIVFDITVPKSFEKAKFWISELTKEKPKDFLKVLIGNKKDLEEIRIILKQDATEYAKENGVLYYETSARTGENIEKVFAEIAGILPRDDFANKSYSVEMGKKGGRYRCC